MPGGHTGSNEVVRIKGGSVNPLALSASGQQQGQSHTHGFFESMTITGRLYMPGVASSIAIGATPPTSASAGTGLWIDRTGLYSLAANVVQVKIDATDGKLYAGAGKIKLDASGITLVDSAGIIYYGANTLLHIYGGGASTESVFLGPLAGGAQCTGGTNVGLGRASMATITSGTANTGVGEQALYSVSTGVQNIGIGRLAGTNISEGGYNIAIGGYTLAANALGSRNVAIGYCAGQYATNGTNDELFINNRDRGTRAIDLAHSLVYGIFADLAANQRLTFNAGIVAVNGGLHVGGTSDPGDNNLLVDGTLQIGPDASNYASATVSADGLLTITTVDQHAALGHIALMPDGNVGIGTASPTDTLTYGRALDIQSTTGAAIYLRDSDVLTNYGLVSYDGGAVDRVNVGAFGAAAYLRLFSGGSVAVSIAANGIVTIPQLATGGADKALYVDSNGVLHTN